MSAQRDTSVADARLDATELEALIAEFKKDVDRGLLRANLKLTPEQRLLQLQSFLDAAFELRQAMKAAQRRQ